MSPHFLRTFRQFDIEEVKKSLMIAGDLTANCAACNALGLDPYKTAVCPECGVTFRYVASRRLDSHPSERFQLARRLAEKRPDLTLIDLSDYKSATGDKSAKEFFGL
ncbi:MAG: hypothetical protein BWY42_01286 [Candidatus Omnitrophica bacterium ADurb.Bin277]|mgnify:CR=1 FL=1|nr:MAG: hypothetical protein BWY42_01286 [Candidatus Omnitrophica bacterium ADurb.Bin277]